MARERVDAVGEADLRTLSDARDGLTALFDRYEERATGSGNFKAFVEFQERLGEFVEDLPADLPERETFEAIDDLLQQRRLSESDFERARERLSTVNETAALLDEREEVRERYRRSRRRVTDALSDIEDRIADLEDVERLGSADLDAPVERLREPVTAYDDGVREAFTDFTRSAPAREVVAFLETTDRYPLVPLRRPPPDLARYVRENEVGDEPIPTLLEYAGYSNSKLDHYVADAGALKRAVATQRTYLERLDAEPLTVGWPPPPAERLQWRARELVAVVGRFADESVLARLHEVRAAARRDDYERLRESALAQSQLDDAERERLERGAVANDLAAAREERERLREALSDHPPL